MLIDEIAVAGSAALAQLLTNIDNFAVLLTLLLTVGKLRAVSGYALSQFLMLTAALALAEGVDRATQGGVGYLGLVPLSLGLFGLWRQYRGGAGAEQPKLPAGAGILATTILFLALSLDSFSVMAPLLADSRPAYRPWVLAGAVVAVAALCFLALKLTQAALPEHWADRFERLGPAAMIAAGIYVLANSGTDQV